MRSDFNVLWVGDQPNRVGAQIIAIDKYMEEEGFKFCPRQCRTLEQVQSAIAYHVFVDEFDLILMDWDLGNGLYGDVIAEVRGALQYKGVVFYSAATKRESYARQLSRRGLRVSIAPTAKT